MLKLELPFFTEKHAAVAVGVPPTISNCEAYKRRIQRKLKEYETVYQTPLLANASTNTKADNAVCPPEAVRECECLGGVHQSRYVLLSA